MSYFIQTTTYAALFYLVYLLFMKNRTAHNWSRAYLLMNMGLPFLLPLLQFPMSSGTEVASFILPVVNVGSGISEAGAKLSFLPLLYGAVACCMLGYLLAQLIQLWRFVAAHPHESYRGLRLIRNSSLGPGSWLTYVFIPAQDADEAVLQHEAAHVRLGHSYDVLAARLLLCFAWPNLMLWFILKELKTVHEFQADAYAAKDKPAYGASLLNELFHTKHFALSHTFFHHPIKRRIMMLNKNAPTGKLMAFSATLLLAGSLVFVQCAKSSESKGRTVKTATTEKTEGDIITDVDVMPEFNGDLVQYLSGAIKYPKEAQAKKIEGKVVAKITINEQGKIETVDIVASPDEILSKAASEVIEAMPDWRPAMKNGKAVKAVVMLPIQYKLS